ncbi:hypothetical protein Lser_V15G03658 [Lactuca serriola]
MKYRYDYLRSKYAVWLKLKKKTGNVYNSITNTFQMTDEEWKAEVKLNKMVEKLRNAPLLYPYLCTQLFDGATSTGATSWGPSSTLPHPAEVFTTQDYEDIEMVDTPSQMDIPALASTVPPPTSASHASGDSSGLEWGNSDLKYITALMLFAENAGYLWIRNLFVVLHLPHDIKFTRKQLLQLDSEAFKGFVNVFIEAIKVEIKNYRVIFNSFYELEPEYAHHYREVMNRKGWHIGPVSLCNKNTKDKSERGKKSAIDEHEYLKWLESKAPDSVVYVSFGTIVKVTRSQFYEIVVGLEACNQDFIWVIKNEHDRWLP